MTSQQESDGKALLPPPQRRPVAHVLLFAAIVTVVIAACAILFDALIDRSFVFHEHKTTDSVCTAPGCMPSWGIKQLATCGTRSWHETVVPLSLMVRLTYTATQGSYYNASEANATVAEWERDLLRTADPPVGLRALLFVQRATRRVVVAFRGTDLNRSCPSGAADACADAILAAELLPPSCSTFSNHTLDYIARALEFTSAAMRAYPGFAFLTAGHSLGGSLAMMAATSLGAPNVSLPAVGFSPGGWRSALRRRTGLEPHPAAVAGRLYALADAWDPVQGSADASGELMGEVCDWEVAPPPGCATCWATGAPPPDWPADVACAACFLSSHIYSNYVYTLVPGPRPTCSATA